jgi:hypothetical protein
MACVFLLLTPAFLSAAALDGIQIVKIAPKDGRAVMKGGDGKLSMIKAGDSIGDGLTVKEITAGRIVLENRTDKGMETVIVRLENGQQRIERLRREPGSRPVLATPTRAEK